MRKVIFITLLAIVSINANATGEWVKIGRDSPHSVTVYVAPATIRKADGHVKMWSLYDGDLGKYIFNYKNYKPFMSIKMQTEYDCKEEKGRTLATLAYSKKMGRGDSYDIKDFNPEKWSTVIPDTMDERQFRFACGKR
jgi:hypothetical protein